MRCISLCDKIWIFFQSVFTSIHTLLVNNIASNPRHFGYFCHRVLVPVAMYIHNIIIENYFHSNNTLVENFPAISLHSIFSLCMLHSTYPTRSTENKPRIISTQPGKTRPGLIYYNTSSETTEDFSSIRGTRMSITTGTGLG